MKKKEKKPNTVVPVSKEFTKFKMKSLVFCLPRMIQSYNLSKAHYLSRVVGAL